MPLTWREKHYGEDGERRFEVESRGGKFRAKNWDGVRIGEYDSLEAAKEAVEDAYKGQGSAPAAEKAPEAPKAPEPPKPASEAPKPAGGHHAPTKGKGR